MFTTNYQLKKWFIIVNSIVFFFEGFNKNYHIILYSEAKNEQAIMESRIAEIEGILKNVKVIDEHELSTEIVHVGSIVKVHDKEYDSTFEYRIVGSNESNPMEGKISDESPVGAGLLGHKVGEVLNIKTPSGVCKYEIVEISK